MTRALLLAALTALALALALGTFVGARLALWLVLWRSGAPAVPDGGWRDLERCDSV